MNDAASIDPRTRKTQSDASNPKSSAWVSANAGSGKTFVLSRRVIRLLLAGVDPGRILCLTFTKAAAAEMAKRVFAELGEWTTLSDADLAGRIADIESAPPDADMLAQARRLFARALDTPGGLKIQTIHALCERLLHQFPFEANVAGHFEVIDEREQHALIDEARRATLARAAGNEDSVLGKALKTVLGLASDRTVEESLAEFIDRRDQISAWIGTTGSLDKAIAGLRLELAVAEDETADTLWDRILSEAPMDADEGAKLVAVLRKGGPNDQLAADRLAPYSESANGDQRINAWLDFFTKKDGDLYSVKTIVSKACKDAWPGLEDLLGDELARLDALIDRLRAAELLESTVAMLHLADVAIAEYERLKRLRGVLDFEDLVVKTVRLLSRVDASRWVHYKLDRGLDHILVDEAQDTSPRQWQVIKALAEEFFAGVGASDTVRTLFAVGDEKQSIFSFQGAVPAWFTKVQREIGSQAKAASYSWSDLELHLSFRSTSVVLAAVDEVFKPEAAHKGLSAIPRQPVHEAWRSADPGRVVIWPLIEPPKKPEPEDWATPVDHLGKGSPEVQLATRIADTIDGWLETGATLDAVDKEGRRQPIRPGGILILCRSRGALTDAINRALKTRKVPIAGADRLILTEHIAVMDLMAAARIVLTPDDDLSLAALLKSPLIGLDEDALFALAHERKGSLFSALTKRAGEREDFTAAKTLLDGWRAEADFRDPHAFFARILGPGKGRQKFLRRLGPEADDVLDEFLAQALAYEQTNVPSLEGFLGWLTASDTEVKRDSDSLRDEVRVMTVHGAKGLEADIVFLVDNGSRPAVAAHDPKVLPLSEAFDPFDPGPLVWMRGSRSMPGAIKHRIDDWRLRSEEEYRRLLYVGMTRARDQLYVVGIRNQNTDMAKGWHALVKTALEPEAVRQEDASGNLVALEWRAKTSEAIEGEPVTEMQADGSIPEWTRTDAPPPSLPVRRVSPSTILRIDEESEFVRKRTSGGPLQPSVNDALERGTLIHRLLQSLPDHPPERRAEVGARYLAAFAVKRTDRDALLAEALAVMADPAFAPIFAAGSRGEVEIAGIVTMSGGPVSVSGRVDRLAVTPTKVLIADYKTNRPAPTLPEDVPRDYVAQLAIYRRVLSQIYPRRIVAAAVVWTDSPSLMEIPAESMDSVEVTIAAA